MQRVILNAFLMTLTVLLFGAMAIWGSAINMRAGSSEELRRRNQGLPRAPLWYESLWERSPVLVLSGVYTCLSVIFVLNLLHFAADSILKLKGQFESPYELYKQCDPTAFWIGCWVWLSPLVAALFMFMRSASRLLPPLDARFRQELRNEVSRAIPLMLIVGLLLFALKWAMEQYLRLFVSVPVWLGIVTALFSMIHRKCRVQK